MKHKTIAAAALAALLAACDSGSNGANDGRTAEGEVLGGTISDEMLPLDTVRSQSPPLRAEPAGDAEEADGGEGDEGEAAAQPPAEEAAAEQAEAQPAPDGAEVNQPPIDSPPQ